VLTLFIAVVVVVVVVVGGGLVRAPVVSRGTVGDQQVANVAKASKAGVEVRGRKRGEGAIRWRR
jgi:hypothetical protein